MRLRRPYGRFTTKGRRATFTQGQERAEQQGAVARQETGDGGFGAVHRPSLPPPSTSGKATPAASAILPLSGRNVSPAPHRSPLPGIAFRALHLALPAAATSSSPLSFVAASTRPAPAIRARHSHCGLPNFERICGVRLGTRGPIRKRFCQVLETFGKFGEILGEF